LTLLFLSDTDTGGGIPGSSFPEKSKITAREAKAIARESLHNLGLSEKQLELIEPPSVNQYKFEESDGTIYPLPYFTWVGRLRNC
jgi:hypothetical protein